ncbi:hypothetical protein D0B54_22945 [Solimonas sp. K1W22B-7]|uniref:hypothetical protein n=1 Tax=Solimonas sp. K1W22B-7 TaxID=2303331 RepID=UPI000E337436|nr:hypothetical protein [Solimonas sp. K1W22B-7]AXQ31365.1 hypothetical protein D0B54_22945 [Solimonas sp. K1W22B-7]
MSAPTSSRLLTAGLALAAQYTLDELAPETIADTTGLSHEQFAAQFGSVDGYLLEMNQQFLDHILDRLVREAGTHSPGLPRMCRATQLQLDICLEHRALRNLLSEARRRMPLVAEAFHRRNHTTGIMIGIELKSLGCPHAAAIGRIYCLMVLETAQIECETGAPNPALRRALADFLANALSAPPAKAAARATSDAL